jgi:type IV pilus assembly protein PilW
MRSLVKASQRGFSLVELMVALLIGVILTSGVISVYITSKASYSLNTGLGQVQEAGRYALGIMQPILVLAGNTGCSHVPLTSQIPSQIIGTDPVYYLRYPVYGFEFTGTGIGDSGGDTSSPTLDNTASDWSPALSVSPYAQAKLNNLAVKGSDVLMVHEMIADPTPATIDGDVSGTLTYATTNAPPIGMVTGMPMIASDCTKDVVAFQATDVTSTTVSHTSSGTPGNDTTVTLQPFNSTKGSVGPVQTYVFFVGKGVGTESSLYEASLDTSGATAGQLGTPREMVPGVESMQILYGVDTDSPFDRIPNNYQTASQVDADGTCPNAAPENCYWNRVVSVRVALVVHSDSNTVDSNSAAASTFHMLGTTAADSFTYTSNVDRRMRRYFVQTFSLRNALP